MCELETIEALGLGFLCGFVPITLLLAVEIHHWFNLCVLLRGQIRRNGL